MAGLWTIMMLLLAVVVGTAGILFSIACSLPQWLRDEVPDGYKDKIVETLQQPAKESLALPASWKLHVVRKLLIQASRCPNYYTNKNSRTLSIAREDAIHKDEFIANLSRSKRVIFGFFHPYCNAGGGGEKVLWKAVQSTLAHNSNNLVVIYTGDNDATGGEILANVQQRFSYSLDSQRIVFIFLKYRKLVDGSTWPNFTLLGQAIGSMILSAEAIMKCPPDIWCDTMGYPFGYPIVHFLCRIPVVTYTHYPVISVDMLGKLQASPSSLKAVCKLYYWKLFMALYKKVGNFVDIAITNSTWTNNHILQIWNKRNSKVIYPPCSTEKILAPHSKWDRLNQAIVIAQFRPEKRYELIIQSYSDYLQQRSLPAQPMNMVLIGSTRSKEDREYVQSLKDWAYKKLNIPQKLLKFHTDCSYKEMKEYLLQSSYGINAMWNEHFGIAVVEYVAAGLIPLVHASAGPLLDIVVPWDMNSSSQASESSNDTRTGFFFRDKNDPDYKKYIGSKDVKYPSLVQLLLSVDSLSDQDKYQISQRGQACVVRKFSDAKFDHDWKAMVLNQI